MLTVVYSCFGIVEWILVFCEVGFDACSIFDFGRFEIAVMEKQGLDEENQEDHDEEGEGKIRFSGGGADVRYRTY